MIGNSNPDELFFRALLFKIFNRTETWELLEHTLGEVRFATYDFGRYDSVLSNAMAIHTGWRGWPESSWQQFQVTRWGMTTPTLSRHE